MGAMNLHISLSVPHAECEALIWDTVYIKTPDYLDVLFATYCSQLTKMMFSPDE